MKIIIKLIILLGFLQNIAYSQNDGDQLAIATYRKIFSQILNEERTVYVSVPEDYQNSGKQYPVLYILDGEYETYTNNIGVARYLSRNKIPEMIIVGIINTNRNRDLFSWKVEGLANTTENGADNFLNFLSHELIPFVDKNYRTTDHRTIYGESAGAHFVTYALVSNPNIFEAYLASSPVIGYSETPLLTKAESFFTANKLLNKSFYIYLGKTDYISVVNNVPLLESIIKKNTPVGFKWEIKWVDDGHVPSESFSELLLMLYPDWKPVYKPKIIPSGGEFLQGETISVELSNTQDTVYYTLNGEDPTRFSPTYNSPIQIDKSTTLKAKSIRGNIQEGYITSSQFFVVDHKRPAIKVTDLKQGLTYQYTEQQLFGTPDSISGLIKKSNIIPTIDLGIRGRNFSFVIQYDGFIKVPTEGQYLLSLLSTNAKFFFDDSLLVYNSGLLPVETTQAICLEAGYHSVRIIVNTVVHPEIVLKLYWTGPEFAKQEIPAEVFFHKE